MPKLTWTLLFVFIFASNHAQLAPLTVDKIMRDPVWMGSSPSSLQWTADGKSLYFNWNPEGAPADSLYLITATNRQPVKASVLQKQTLLTRNSITYNQAKTAYLFTRDGDVYYVDIKSGNTRRITQTTDGEFNPQFSFNETKVVYNRSQNLYAWDIRTGETQQLTNIRAGSAAGTTRKESSTSQEDWLKKDQLQYFEVLRSRKEKKEAGDDYNKNTRVKEMRVISMDEKSLQGLTISPDGRFVSYALIRSANNAKTTIVPNYVTESGFTTDIPARTKVGGPAGTAESFIYDRERDTVYALKTDSIPGIKEIPAFYSAYPRLLEEKKKKNENRSVRFSGASWAPGGQYVVFDIRSDDNKDRWLMQWDTSTTTLKLLSRQHDDAWIGGPGSFSTGWIDGQTFWFQSEETGYAHLYTINPGTGEKKTLTSGNYEVQQVRLSNDKRSFYFITNEVHPGEQHFYKYRIADGKKEKLTTMTGANQVALSPDEKWLGILYSYSTQPWELYLQENKNGAVATKITDKAQSAEFKSYPWRDPEVITIPAADGQPIYARLYKPSNPHPSKPAVLFVHGAGYLQNAHKWWSSYFREYMFNNLLADNGYYVLDIDYRGSAGYGRDWRTGIYRHMGGKDLSDHVDAVNFLVKNHGVNPANVGVYGGSYGGFISLMALFTEAKVFKAGAALRPVTDWAQYNHGYTSNILNEPTTDSIAYRKSSPLYFAEGLKGHLLICHGMVDVNVHYQDAVKLSQRLIELGKDNWELASYPMEDHAFVEPSSWTDEYKRIFKLFENILKN